MSQRKLKKLLAMSKKAEYIKGKKVLVIVRKKVNRTQIDSR